RHEESSAAGADSLQRGRAGPVAGGGEPGEQDHADGHRDDRARPERERGREQCDDQAQCGVVPPRRGRAGGAGGHQAARIFSACATNASRAASRASSGTGPSAPIAVTEIPMPRTVPVSMTLPVASGASATVIDVSCVNAAKFSTPSGASKGSIVLVESAVPS